MPPVSCPMASSLCATASLRSLSRTVSSKRFRSLRSLRDPAAFVVLAEYTDRRAAEAHRAGDRYRELVQDTIAPMLIDRQTEFHTEL